jgi:hypothetical protein
MSLEQKNTPELTPEQLEMADYLVEECGLSSVASEVLMIQGQSGSVRYGLGRCATHLIEMTPSEINEWVMAKLENQATTSARESTT